MILSYLWIKDFVDLREFEKRVEKAGKESCPNRIADLLTFRGIEVESVKAQAEGLSYVVSAQIIDKKPHPNADRLSLCQVIIQDKGESFQIVCGATNMKKGDKVALAQVGANLPNGLQIKKGKIRGEDSNGMLCSESELQLSKESEGIIILPPDTRLGLPIAEVLGRNDVLFEVSITPNRGDCLSHLGIARELAAATESELLEPRFEWLKPDGGNFRTAVNAGLDGPQFWMCEIEGVQVKASPQWLKNRLEAVGIRSINNVVDATNYVMLEFGHPMHAYDAKKIKGKKLSIEVAKKGTRLKLLDEKEIELLGSELVIVDESGPVSLAGVMGGALTQVTAETTHLLLECAEFKPGKIRRAAQHHAHQSEASHRFERGVDPNGLRRSLSRLASMIANLSGGEVKACSSSAVDAYYPNNDFMRPIQGPLIHLDVRRMSRFLGLELTAAKIEAALEKIGCVCERLSNNEIEVRVPSFRHDLVIVEDLAEEVARIIGYDQIPSTIPRLSSAPSSSLDKVDQAKDVLARLGLLEAIHYGFTSKKWLSEFDMTSDVKVENPLSEETEVMVPSLIPGLVGSALRNWNHHFGSESLPIRLFELRPTFSLKQDRQGIDVRMDSGVVESWSLALLMSGPRLAQGLKSELAPIDFFDLKEVVEDFFSLMAIPGLRFQKSGADNPLFHPGQSAQALMGKGVLVGTFGRLHPRLEKRLKAREAIWIADFNWDQMRAASLSTPKKFRSFAEYPSMERDFALLVKDDVTAGDIMRVAIKAGAPIAKNSKVFDIYKGAQIGQGMTSMGVRVIFINDSRSLTELEVEEASGKILAQWKKELGVGLRS